MLSFLIRILISYTARPIARSISSFFKKKKATSAMPPTHPKLDLSQDSLTTDGDLARSREIGDPSLNPVPLDASNHATIQAINKVKPKKGLLTLFSQKIREPLSAAPKMLQQEQDQGKGSFKLSWSEFKNKTQALYHFLQDKEWQEKLRHHPQWKKLSTRLFPHQQKKVAENFQLLLPREKKGSWQCWSFATTSPKDEKEKSESNITPISQGSQTCSSEELSEIHAKISAKNSFIVGIPTQELLMIPLWVANSGNLEELIDLELRSKQLLRRGVEDGVHIETIVEEEERILVTVQTPLSSISPGVAPYLKEATFFETALRLSPASKADLLLWHELGKICFAFLRDQKLIWFSVAREEKLSSPLLQQIQIVALRLQTEKILSNPIEKIELRGSFSPREIELVQSLHPLLPTLSGGEKSSTPLEHRYELLQKSFETPSLPSTLIDLPPEEAAQERQKQAKINNLKKIGMFILALYVCFLLLLGCNLLIQKSILTKLQLDLKHQLPAIDEAQKTISEWDEFRSAISPTTYALDIIAAVATPIQGDDIRLTNVSKENGELRITGEASNVTQAYRFIDLIKKNHYLQEYQWSSGQPKLVGQNNVQFEMEGTPANAKASSK